jgi:hypothetical protein
MLPTHLQCDYNTAGSEVYLMSGNGFIAMWELHWEVNYCYYLLINAVSIDDIFLILMRKIPLFHEMLTARKPQKTLLD